MQHSYSFSPSYTGSLSANLHLSMLHLLYIFIFSVSPPVFFQRGYRTRRCSISHSREDSVIWAIWEYLLSVARDECMWKSKVTPKWHPGADSISGVINITARFLFKHTPVRTVRTSLESHSRIIRPCLNIFRTVQLTQIKCMQSWSAACRGCRILLCLVRRDIQWWKFDTEHLLVSLMRIRHMDCVGFIQTNIISAANCMDKTCGQH